MKTYVSYLRDSGGPSQETSTDQQAAEVESLAQREGIIITRTFRDRARSGSSTVGREQFLAMIAYLEKPSTTEAGVILWSYSRFARDYDDTQFYLAALRRAGRTILSVTDSIPEGLDGRLMESLVAWQNAKFLETLSVNIKRGQRYVCQELKGWPGGRTPLGYKLERKQSTPRSITILVPDPRTSVIVQQIYQRRAAGEKYTAIGERFGQDDHAIRYICNNKIYTGVYEARGYEVTGFCQPIIDKKLWQQVQRINAAQFHPRHSISVYTLSTVLICGSCGSNMGGTTTKNHQYNYYRCSKPCGARYIPMADLETIVFQAVREYLSDAEMLKQIHTLAIEQMTPEAETVPDLLQARRHNQRDIDRVVDAITVGGHSAALLEKLHELESEQAEIKKQIHQQQTAASAPNFDDVLAYSRDLLATLTDATPIQQKHIIAATINSITATRLPDGSLDVDIVFRAVSV